MKKININGMNKLQVIKLIFNETEIKNIDCSIPLQYQTKNNFFSIMNYNKNILGKLQDLRSQAKKKNIELIY